VVSAEKETTIRPSLFLLAVHHSLFARRTCGADANMFASSRAIFAPEPGAPAERLSPVPAECVGIT